MLMISGEQISLIWPAVMKADPPLHQTKIAFLHNFNFKPLIRKKYNKLLTKNSARNADNTVNCIQVKGLYFIKL